MKKLLDELKAMQLATRQQRKHIWHGKNLMDVVHSSYIHELITRSEWDELKVMVGDDIYGLSKLVEAIESKLA